MIKEISLRRIFLAWDGKGSMDRISGNLHPGCCRLHLKCDGTRAEIGFRLSTKRTSPFKSAGGVSSVDYWQSSCTHQPAGFVPLAEACVLQSCDGYWLPTPFSCLPFTSPPVRHRVPSHFNWTLRTAEQKSGQHVKA